MASCKWNPGVLIWFLVEFKDSIQSLWKKNTQEFNSNTLREESPISINVWLWYVCTSLTKVPEVAFNPNPCLLCGCTLHYQIFQCSEPKVLFLMDILGKIQPSKNTTTASEKSKHEWNKICRVIWVRAAAWMLLSVLGFGVFFREVKIRQQRILFILKLCSIYLPSLWDLE